MKAGIIILAVSFLAGCTTAYSLKVTEGDCLGKPIASVQEEAKNPMTHNRSQTTLLTKDEKGELKVLAHSHHGGDGVAGKALVGFVSNAPIGAGLGTMYLGRAPDTTTNSTSVSQGGQTQTQGQVGINTQAQGQLQGQAQGQLQGQAQGQVQGQTQTSSGFVPPGHQD